MLLKILKIAQLLYAIFSEGHRLELWNSENRKISDIDDLKGHLELEANKIPLYKV
jgi:hypothetical protein